MIFITGAAGFIGSNFAHYLSQKGFDDVKLREFKLKEEEI